jgi:hypothetical protein
MKNPSWYPAFTFSPSAAHYNAKNDIQTDRNDSDMTSNETGTPGLAVERGAAVAVWRQIEQILSAKITAKRSHSFANQSCATGDVG